MHKGILFIDNSDAILYQPGQRLLYLLAITTFLHLFILLTVDFQPLWKVFETLANPAHRAVSLTLEKSLVSPKVAHYINLVDHQGQLTGDPIDVQTEPQSQPLNSVQIQQNEVSFIAISKDKESGVQLQDRQRHFESLEGASVPKIVSVATHQQAHAAYLYRWQQYIEAIGSEFYPKEALQKNITGQLTLRVVILEAGEVKEIEIYQTSGQALLDQAAVDIIARAQPFERVPKIMLADNEGIEIIRVWDFRGKLTPFSSNMQS